MVAWLDDLDVDMLKKLVELKEQNAPLVELEKKRRRLARQLERVEAEIRRYVDENPASKRLLDAVEREVGNGAGQPAPRRPRGWVGKQIQVVFGETPGPLTPSEIRDRIAARHPEMAGKSLYLSIFQHLRRREEYRKTGEGWVRAT